MSNPNSSQLRRSAPRYRPATIAELAEEAQKQLWDSSKGLKHWLRTAEKARTAAKKFQDSHDYESAFIEYARAATIVLEKLPTHSEYQNLLSGDQRHNLGQNGQDILDSLSKLKPLLVQRYEEWRATAGTSSEPTETRLEAMRRRREEQQRMQDEERSRNAHEATRREQEWRRDALVRRQSEGRVSGASISRPSGELTRRREDSLNMGDGRRGDPRDLSDQERNPRYRQDEDPQRLQGDEDEALRRRVEEKRRFEQDGIARRQQEADAAARAARQQLAYGMVSAIIPPVHPSTPASRMEPQDRSIRGNMAIPVSMPIATPQPSRPSSSTQGQPFADPYQQPSFMPLESPTRYDDDSSTDAEGKEHDWHRPRHADRTPTKARHLPIHYPPAVTTTSPPPPDMGPVRYPSLMSQHQLKQGYVPSLQSMFNNLSLDPPAPDSSLLFESKPTGNDLYSNILPRPSQPPYPPVMSAPEPRQYYPPQNNQYQRGPSPAPVRPPLPQPPTKEPAPPPVPPALAPAPAPAPASSSRIVPGGSRDANIRELKTVRFPRECLHKFVSIARINTLQNKETCGLLLGKDKGSKFVVTTLLIPKQRATSDTCTMDEEELVLSFTEERSLITLGWIHTHPTQSCFMSSVDLHTHSGFQRMLPESFAVVCAPSSTPSFGIFRLTDPGGLQTILECTAKEAFHPHPEVPIYTDCDNCHVQMKDIPLEIVDLRT